MRLLDYECQTTFQEVLVQRNFSEKKQLKKLIGELEQNGSVIRFAEQNCLWCLIINVGIGTEELTLGLADYILSFGKNIMIGCQRIGEVKIWGII